MLRRTAAVGVAIVLLAGCATGRAYRSGQQAARSGDWDAAVAYYRTALKNDPSRVDIKIALQRASLAASAEHMARAKELEAQEQWAAAAAEYRLAADLDAANVFAAAGAAKPLPAGSRISYQTVSCGNDGATTTCVDSRSQSGFVISPAGSFVLNEEPPLLYRPEGGNPFMN